jgi:hypothetical protein
VNKENGEDKKIEKRVKALASKLALFIVTFIADISHIQTTCIIDKPVPFMEQILRKFKK